MFDATTRLTTVDAVLGAPVRGRDGELELWLWGKIGKEALPPLSDADVLSVLQRVAEGLGPRLKRFGMHRNALTGAAFGLLGGCLTHVLGVFLQDNLLDNDGAAALARGLHGAARLEILLVSNNDIGDDGLLLLANAVLAHCPHMQTFGVAGNARLTDDALLATARTLSPTRVTLQSRQLSTVEAVLACPPSGPPGVVIDLANQHLSDDQLLPLWRHLAAGLGLRVASIVLNGNAITGRDLALLAHAIPYVTFVNLSSNAIGDAHAPELAAALAGAKNIVMLFLSRNKVGDEGARAITAAARAHCPHVSMLSFHSCENITDAGHDAVVRLLKAKGGIFRTDSYTPAKQMEALAELREQDRREQEMYATAASKVAAALHSQEAAEARNRIREKHHELASLLLFHPAGGSRDGRDGTVERETAVRGAFAALQDMARAESERLNVLMRSCRAAYEEHSPARYCELAAVPSEPTVAVQPMAGFLAVWDAAQPLPMQRLDWLLAQAAHVDAPFQEAVAELVARFNAAETPVELGLTEAEFPLPLQTELQREQGCNAVEMAAGPVKLKDRCLLKVKDDYTTAPVPEKCLLDLVRTQLRFSNPYALACFRAMLVLPNACDRARGDSAEGELVLVRTKNKFGQDYVDEGGSEYKDLLVNVEFRGHVCELQLALSDLAEMKRQSHGPYKVQRSNHPGEICGLLSSHANKHVVQKALRQLQRTATEVVRTEQLAAKEHETEQLRSKLEQSEREQHRLAEQVAQLQRQLAGSSAVPVAEQVEGRAPGAATTADAVAAAAPSVAVSAPPQENAGSSSSDDDE